MIHQTIDWQTIAAHISKTTGLPFQIQAHSQVAGGCINNAYRIEGNGQNYFVKLNRSQHQEMFAAEVAGLTELRKPAVIKAPEPLCWGIAGGHSYLVMEYLALHGETQTQSVSSQLGQQLAALHQVTQAQFGWHHDNYIGLTPQVNSLENDWVTFWQNHRLGFQLDLAAHKGYGGKLQRNGQVLMAEVGQFFTDYQPQPF